MGKPIRDFLDRLELPYIDQREGFGSSVEIQYRDSVQCPNPIRAIASLLSLAWLPIF
jgi:hypothetical protein